MLKILTSIPRRVSALRIALPTQFPQCCRYCTGPGSAGQSSSTEKTTHFGFDTVREDEKEEKGK